MYFDLVWFESDLNRTKSKLMITVDSYVSCSVLFFFIFQNNKLAENARNRNLLAIRTMSVVGFLCVEKVRLSSMQDVKKKTKSSPAGLCIEKRKSNLKSHFQIE